MITRVRAPVVRIRFRSTIILRLDISSVNNVPAMHRRSDRVGEFFMDNHRMLVPVRKRFRYVLL